jgi:hypothetical protein
LRRIVRVSGALLGLAGIPPILTLPVNLWLRLALASGWAAVSFLELRRLSRAWRLYRRLRIDSGGAIALLDVTGRWRSGSLVSGGILLRKIGWIRLRDHTGKTFGELLVGDSRASSDWRRLQVIWRHIGA